MIRTGSGGAAAADGGFGAIAALLADPKAAAAKAQALQDATTEHNAALERLHQTQKELSDLSAALSDRQKELDAQAADIIQQRREIAGEQTSIRNGIVKLAQQTKDLDARAADLDAREAKMIDQQRESAATVQRQTDDLLRRAAEIDDREAAVLAGEVKLAESEAAVAKAASGLDKRLAQLRQIVNG